MRYVLKFKKEGYMIYTSHLDVMRLFKRSFKRASIYLSHSQGFNPHPKMSFAQPLSLGYIGMAELLEFETKEELCPHEILQKMSELMPEGLSLIDCKMLKIEEKSMAALTFKAEYTIKIPNEKGLSQSEADDLLKSFLSQNQVVVKKQQKKTGKEIVLDIKPMIVKISAVVNYKYIGLTCEIDAGSNSNLSPELILQSFSDFCDIKVNRYDVKVVRNKIYFR